MALLPWGFEQQWQPPPRKTSTRLPAIQHRSGFIGSSLQKAGWEVQPPQPPVYPKTNQKTAAALSQREDGIEYPVQRFRPAGWEIQPPQPPFYPKTNQKISALSQWEDGTEYKFQRFFPGGWEVQPYQPPFRFLRNLDNGDTGIQAKFIPPVATLPEWGHDPVWADLRYLRRFNLDSGDQGIQAAYINWLNSGWEIQPPPPPHPIYKSPEVGDTGIQAPYINWKNVGWEVQPVQPPYRFYRNLDDGDRGIQAPLVITPIVPVPLNWGFELQSGWQPPYWVRTNQLWGALSQWEDGIELPYIPPVIPPPPGNIWAPQFLQGSDGVDLLIVQYGPNITAGDLFIPLARGDLVDRTVQVEGVFAGATVNILGSNDAISKTTGNYRGLRDWFSNTIAFTSPGIVQINELTAWLTPLITGGIPGTTNITITICHRLSRRRKRRK